MLPIAPFTETAGTFVNCEGRAQSFNGTVQPLGEARPGWKVLRVLGNLLGLAGLRLRHAEQVRSEATAGRMSTRVLSNDTRSRAATPQHCARNAGAVERIADVPIYFSDRSCAARRRCRRPAMHGRRRRVRMRSTLQAFGVARRRQGARAAGRSVGVARGRARRRRCRRRRACVRGATNRPQRSARCSARSRWSARDGRDHGVR